MRTTFMEGIKKAKVLFRSIYKYFAIRDSDGVKVDESKSNGTYYSLSPVGNADPNGHYSEALFWALNNREAEDIRNIALTGPYGSGKSSILKTFQKNYADDKLVFMNISLATFKEEKSEGPTDVDMLRLIELSILQQILYHERDENIPDSRFKKTKSLSKHTVRNTAISVFIFVICLAYQLNPTLVQNTLRISLEGWKEVAIHYTTLAISIVGVLIFIWRTIRPLRSIQLKKLNFQDAEFALDDSISKSVLNEHLNELLYFFEVTKYNVVVIEDLDRFEQTEIFTKLRELNFLIKNCEKIDRNIVFIYAVRDDMFQDTNRTKFFDFIIPIIPVINSSNSSEKLRKIVLENSYEIDDKLIDNISYFINDMRLLYNVMNEYRLYNKKVSTSLDQNKLLAIIVYKNLFPQDFAELSDNKGDLYTVFDNKQSYIAHDISQIEVEIMALEDEIKELEVIPVTDIRELRKLYILQYLSKNVEAVGFSVNNDTYSMLDMAEDNLFQLLIEDKVSYWKVNRYGTDIYEAINYKFKSIQHEVDAKFTYHERFDRLNRIRSGRLSICSKLLDEKLKEKERIHNRSIKEHMLNDAIELKIENEKQRQLVSILLREGFIDEHYIDFITIFYEGSISRTDQEFLINVKAHLHNNFDYKLQHIDKLISKIPAAEFTRRYLLNFDLLDYLLSHDNYKSERENVLDTICDKSKLSTRFLITYLDHSHHIDIFIQLMVKRWPEMWAFLTDQRSERLATDRKQKLVTLILEHADVEDIKKVANTTSFAEYCESNPGFLGMVQLEGMTLDEKSHKIERMKSIITSLNLKLKVISTVDCPDELIDFVYENNMYEINEFMVDTWVEKKWTYSNTEYKVHNYSFLTKHEELYKPMLSYIDEYINDYISKVWVRFPYDANEDSLSLVRILNNEELTTDSIQLIFQHNSTSVISLVDIDDYEIMGLLFDAHKIDATWENVMSYYQLTQKSIDDHLLNFLNSKSVAESLSNKVYPSHGKEQEVLQKDFAKELVLQDSIDNVFYDELTKQIPLHFNHVLSYTGLSTEKIEILLRQKKINVNSENFQFLRSSHPNTHIKLIGRNTAQVLRNAEKYDFTVDDIAMILESEDIALKLKSSFLKNVDAADIFESTRLSGTIGKLMFKNPKFDVDSNVIAGILVRGNQPSSILVELFLRHFTAVTKEDFFGVMQKWAAPYNEIIPNGKQVVLVDNVTNWKFAMLIYKRGFIYEPKKDKKGVRIYNLKK